MSRLDLPSVQAMTPDQLMVCAEAKSGPRGKVPEPMYAWVRNPELARRTQKLGELLRFDTTIEPHLVEMAILVCARHWTAHLEWTAHKAKALNAGLDPRIIDDIAAHRTPTFDDARAEAIYATSHVLLATGRVPADIYTNALEQLGEQGLVELVAILGYYCLASLTLNTFELGLPQALAPELNDPEFSGAVEK